MKKFLFSLFSLLVICTMSLCGQLRVFTIGDSTVQDYNDGYAPRKGWGQMLPFFFDQSKAVVYNKAVGGTSSKSYYNNHWTAVKNQLKEGDYVFIQFGINDRNSSDADRYAPKDVFNEYIKKFVADIQAKKAIPVLVSTVRRCAWNNGVLYDSYHEHPQLMRDLATELGLPIVDLDQFCYDLFTSQGQLYAERFCTMHLMAGEYTNYPNGNTDQVHYQEIGATENARFVVETIEKSTNADLKKLAACTLPRHKVTIKINDTTKSQAISRSAEFPEGINITLKTIPQTNAKFLRWEDGSKNLISTKSLYVMKMGGYDVVYKAIYESDVVDDNESDPADEETVHANGKKIAYITVPDATNYANDTRILPMLKSDDNLSVYEVNANSGTVDFSGYDMILISEITPSTAPIMSLLKGISKPMLSMKVHGYKNADGAWKWANTGYGDNTEATNIVVADNMKQHPMFKEVSFENGNEVQMVSKVDTKGITYMNPASFTDVEGSISSIANVKDEVEQVSILEVAPGTSINGTVLADKYVQIGVNSSSYANITDDGLSIVKNACYYLMDTLFYSPSDVAAIETAVSDCAQVILYPNPVKEMLSIAFNTPLESAANILLYSIDGRIVYQTTVAKGTVRLDVASTSEMQGVMLLQIKTANATLLKSIVKFE